MLFIGPLPDPVTGQSLACKIFYDELKKFYKIEVVNLNSSKLKSGFGSFGRLFEVLSGIGKSYKLAKSAKMVYFTISESFAGNMKDILTYIVCYRRLRGMIIHLHGGAGMRVLMGGGHGLLWHVNAFFLKRTAAIIVLGSRHLDVFNGAVPARLLTIVPNFAQSELFVSELDIRTKFASIDPIRLLFLSNLIPGKGHEELLSAFLSLDETVRKGFRLDFAGAFESEDSKRVFLAKISAHSEITYHGVVSGENKRHLFSSAHVFTLPTYYPYEGQPISILEAYASGCAVVTTDHSGIFDIFKNGHNGFAVTPQSVPSLVAVLKFLVQNRDNLLRHALLNREEADKFYTEEIFNSRLLDIVRKTERQLDNSIGLAQPA